MLLLLLHVIAAASLSLGAPVLRASSGYCLTDESVEALIANWANLLSHGTQTSSMHAAQTSGRIEYTTSMRALSWYCPQSDRLAGSPANIEPGHTHKLSHAASQISHPDLAWDNPVITHDCSTIAVKGSMHVMGDNELFNAVALLDTQPSARGVKVAKLFWEFDVAAAQRILAAQGRCRDAAAKGSNVELALV